MTASYGIWDSEGETLSDEIRLNIIGNMSGSYEFGLENDAGLTDQAEKSLEKLWWKEAEPDAEDYFLNKRARDEDWSGLVSSLWKRSDTDRNGSLTLAEFGNFFDELRVKEDRFTNFTKYD